MSVMNIFVCENYSVEYRKIINELENKDINLISFPCMCEQKNNYEAVKSLFDKSDNKNSKSIVFCSEYCDILKITKNLKDISEITQKYCFNHLASNQMIEYIIGKGGYVIGLGWLNTWEERLKNQGFNKDTARAFFKESCKELVFFDARIDTSSKKKLEDLSKYLDIPYIIIDFELDALRFVLENEIAKWKLENSNINNKKAILEAQNKCAEYASILDILSKLTKTNNKLDAINRIEEIFVKVMGAKKFEFNDDFRSQISLLDESNSYFQIVIENKGEVYGVIKTSGFLFPQHIRKYYNFALSISQICALVLENIEHYEDLLRHKELLEYENSHDNMTGLYNRNYFNKISKKEYLEQNVTIFSFDVDKLKFVNDNYGHSEGDKLLKNVAKILIKTFKKESVFRIGGDEFICLITDCDFDMANKLLIKFYENVEKHNKKVKWDYQKISISVGYSISDNDCTIDYLLKSADANMYQDKANKRGKDKL